MMPRPMTIGIAMLYVVLTVATESVPQENQTIVLGGITKLGEPLEAKTAAFMTSVFQIGNCCCGLHQF